jgi:hypothetical protein
LKEINLYNPPPQKKYILATKISATYFEGLSRTKISDETICFSPYLLKKFVREEVLEIAQRQYYIKDLKSFLIGLM